MPAKVKSVTAQKDYPQFGIKAGEVHYFWQLFSGGRGVVHRSKVKPRPSQLESSEYLVSYYQLRETAEDLCLGGVEESDIESLISEIEQLRDDTTEKLSNMPQGLQSGDTGVLMQERVDELEEWLAALNDIESSVGDPDDNGGVSCEEQRSVLLRETL